MVDLPAEIGLSRIAAKDADRMEKESLSFHRNVRDGFLAIAASEQARYVILDGKKSIDEIHLDVIKAVEEWRNNQ